MKTRNFIILLALVACQASPNLEQAAHEIREAEEAFAQSADKNGVSAAFNEFAAEDAVISRGRIIKSREAIGKFYETTSKDVKLSWKADTVLVATSGDLGYTYGSYLYQAKDSLGGVIQSRGVFHSIWRKQKDGKWKFVWD